MTGVTDEGRSNAIEARRHYTSLDAERQAFLQAEWKAAEHDRQRIEAERRAIAAKTGDIL